MKDSVNRFKRVKRFVQHVEATLRERYAPGRKVADKELSMPPPTGLMELYLKLIEGQRIEMVR